MTQTEYDKAVDELTDTFIKKNADYGDSFDELYKDLGFVSALTQIVHKVNRAKSLCKTNGQANHEGLRDTIKDLANYSIMTLALIDKYSYGG